MKRITLFVALIGATLLVGCGNKTSDKNYIPLKVETETVGNQSHSTGKSYIGEIEAQTTTAVSFTSMGVVQKVCVEEGQHVSKGQVLAVMDPTQNRNTLEAATAILTQAQDAYERMKVLHDNNSLSDMDWVEVQSKVQQARSSLQMAKKALDDCTLKAPCSGVIGQKMMQTGQTALPSQPVCNILNINNVKVKVSVPEKEIASITPSTPTLVAVDAIGETVSGGRIEKGVQGDALTHTYNIYVNVNNSGQRLLPGMVANVMIGGEEVAFSLPIRAVQQGADGKNFVWIKEGTQARRRNITLGETFGNRIEILSGIKKGEKVIVEGYQKVSEGSEVE